MPHAKFQDPNSPLDSGEKDFLKILAVYSPGDRFGHVTWTIYTFLSPILSMLNMKCSFDWSSRCF